jgi:hypothetical protein
VEGWVQALVRVKVQVVGWLGKRDNGAVVETGGVQALHPLQLRLQ